MKPSWLNLTDHGEYQFPSKNHICDYTNHLVGSTFNPTLPVIIFTEEANSKAVSSIFGTC